MEELVGQPEQVALPAITHEQERSRQAGAIGQPRLRQQGTFQDEDIRRPRLRLLEEHAEGDRGQAKVRVKAPASSWRQRLLSQFLLKLHFWRHGRSTKHELRKKVRQQVEKRRGQHARNELSRIGPDQGRHYRQAFQLAIKEIW